MVPSCIGGIDCADSSGLKVDVMFLDLLADLPDFRGRVLMAGHNPDSQDAAEQISQEYVREVTHWRRGNGINAAHSRNNHNDQRGYAERDVLCAKLFALLE